MPTEGLKDKVESILEEKIPSIESKLVEVAVKQDNMISKLDDLSFTIKEHVTLQTKHELRIAAIETKDSIYDKTRDRRRSILIAISASSAAAAVGFFIKWFIERLSA